VLDILYWRLPSCVTLGYHRFATPVLALWPSRCHPHRQIAYRHHPELSIADGTKRAILPTLRFPGYPIVSEITFRVSQVGANAFMSYPLHTRLLSTSSRVTQTCPIWPLISRLSSHQEEWRTERSQLGCLKDRSLLIQSHPRYLVLTSLGCRRGGRLEMKRRTRAESLQPERRLSRRLARNREVDAPHPHPFRIRAWHRKDPHNPVRHHDYRSSKYLQVYAHLPSHLGRRHRQSRVHGPTS
jgi:hypothetical protein